MTDDSEQLFDWLQEHYGNVGVTPALREAYDAYRAAKPPTGWQPIETAPKDGRDVLLYRSHWSKSIPVVAGWYEDGWYTFDDADVKVPEMGGITHWQPLPEPPTE